MFMEHQATSKNFRLNRFEHASVFLKKTELDCNASDFYYSPRNSETIYAIPTSEEDKKIECFTRKSNKNKQKMNNNKLLICQIIVVLTCLMVSCINVYFLMKFKFEANLSQQSIESQIKDLQENEKSLKQYMKQMENDTKYLLNMVEPLQAYVCQNFIVSKLEKRVLGCVTGVYK